MTSPKLNFISMTDWKQIYRTMIVVQVRFSVIKQLSRIMEKSQKVKIIHIIFVTFLMGSPVLSSLNKCKSYCSETFAHCSHSSQHYGKIVQCALDMSDCKEYCYKRRLSTIQLRLVVTKKNCAK